VVNIGRLIDESPGVNIINDIEEGGFWMDFNI